MKKILPVLFLFLLFGVVIFVWASPYRKGKISESIVINTQAKKLYQYLGNSGNAKYWSSYVSNIEVLNPGAIDDGAEGSKRRCFKKNEDGVWWDEEILQTIENKYRKLNIYKMNGFPMESEALLTEQLYEVLENGQTRLSLTLYADPDRATLWDKVKMHLASYMIASVFEANLENIKNLNEKT